MDDIFPILVAVTVAMLVWGVTVLVINVVRNEKGKLSERLSGTSGSTGTSASATSIVVQSDTEGLPPLLARMAMMRGLHRQLIHAYPEASLVRFLSLSVGLALLAGIIMFGVTDSGLV